MYDDSDRSYYLKRIRPGDLVASIEEVVGRNYAREEANRLGTKHGTRVDVYEVDPRTTKIAMALHSYVPLVVEPIPREALKDNPLNPRANRTVDWLTAGASMLIAHEPVVIGRVRDPFGWMGNMSPHGVIWCREYYRTTEALFQCMRFSAETHPAIRWEIQQQTSPMAAKMVAKKHQQHMVISPCGPRDVENMECCLQLKLDYHSTLLDQLMQTDQRHIVEDCTRRQRGSGLFWGAALQADGQWKGENQLGRLWMKIREINR